MDTDRAQVYITQAIDKAKESQCNFISLNYCRLPHFPEVFLKEPDAFRWILHIHLKHNALETLPSDLRGADHLVTLYLAWNKMSCLPASLSHLASLSYLDLEGNFLTHLPRELGDLKCLKKLNVARNNLREVPATIGRLENLATLQLTQNELTSLPPELSRCRQLTGLWVTQNKLVELPRQVTLLDKLQELCVDVNRLTSLPLSLSWLAHLHILSTDKNPALRYIPSHTATLSSYRDCGMTDGDTSSTCVTSVEIGPQDQVTISLPSPLLTAHPTSAVPLVELACRAVYSALYKGQGKAYACCDVNNHPLAVYGLSRHIVALLQCPSLRCAGCATARFEHVEDTTWPGRGTRQVAGKGSVVLLREFRCASCELTGSYGHGG